MIGLALDRHRPAAKTQLEAEAKAELTGMVARTAPATIMPEAVAEAGIQTECAPTPRTHAVTALLAVFAAVTAALRALITLLAALAAAAAAVATRAAAVVAMAAAVSV